MLVHHLNKYNVLTMNTAIPLHVCSAAYLVVLVEAPFALLQGQEVDAWRGVKAVVKTSLRRALDLCKTAYVYRDRDCSGPEHDLSTLMELRCPMSLMEIAEHACNWTRKYQDRKRGAIPWQFMVIGTDLVFRIYITGRVMTKCTRL